MQLLQIRAFGKPFTDIMISENITDYVKKVIKITSITRDNPIEGLTSIKRMQYNFSSLYQLKLSLFNHRNNLFGFDNLRKTVTEWKKFLTVVVKEE